MYINSQKQLYVGDCAQGDREATNDEISVWHESRKTTYSQLRAAEYPPYSDYLDSVVKGDEAQKQAYIDACIAVKKKYPK